MTFSKKTNENLSTFVSNFRFTVCIDVVTIDFEMETFGCLLLETYWDSKGKKKWWWM